MAVGTGDVTHPQNESRKKVLGTTLQLFNRQPLTGFNRDELCRVTAGDFGNTYLHLLKPKLHAETQ
jgi:uncharacterized protein (DUF2237 family)